MVTGDKSLEFDFTFSLNDLDPSIDRFDLMSTVKILPAAED